MAKSWFRACERRAVQMPARLNGRGTGVFPGQLVNLGLGGACAMVSDALPIGQHLVLELQPPNLWDPLRVSSRVVWCRRRDTSFLVGLHFELDGAPMMGLLVDLMTAGTYD